MKRVVFAMFVGLISVSLAWADQVILDDLIVDGSACIGQDCVNGESFGFDTLRLKENNLRIKFQDTSNSASFPSNDWQITANDSSNGGANKFSIDDIDGGRTPFTIEAGAPSHSLYVDDGGRIGFGTSTPVVELHVKDGDTPTLRLEQDGSSGFTPQTWDMAGNETNFFIRDVSNGSTLPFRIRPGAPTSSIDIAAGGDVGIGTSSPDAALHVIGGDVLMEAADSGVAPTASLHVRRATGGAETLLRLTNDNVARFVLENTAGSPETSWRIVHDGGSLRINTNNTNNEFELDSMTGDLTIKGNLTELSDVNAKDNITPVDGQLVLAKLDELSISTWSRKSNTSEIRHLSPMAQDFRQAFGLGHDDRLISPLDVAGVALAGVKELRQEVQAKDARIAEKNARIEAMEKRIATLEELVIKLIQKN